MDWVLRSLAKPFEIQSIWLAERHKVGYFFKGSFGGIIVDSLLIIIFLLPIDPCWKNLLLKPRRTSPRLGHWSSCWLFTQHILLLISLNAPVCKCRARNIEVSIVSYYTYYKICYIPFDETTYEPYWWMVRLIKYSISIAKENSKKGKYFF